MADHDRNHSNVSELYFLLCHGGYDSDYIFRGQGDSSFHLTPGIAREDTEYERWEFESHKVNADGSTTVRSAESMKISVHEFRLLKRFIRGCDRCGISVPGDGDELRRQLGLSDDLVPIPFGMRFSEVLEPEEHEDSSPLPDEWPTKEVYPLMAMAQHHGLKTRLLDWSKDPMVAMYFASVDGMKRLSKGEGGDKRIAVWAANGSQINSCKKSQFYVMEYPSSLSVNISVQQGCFTTLIGGSARVETYKMDEVPLVRRHVQKHTLEISQSPKLFRLCYEKGYSGARLFPGPDGATKEANELSMLKSLERKGFK